MSARAIDVNKLADARIREVRCCSCYSTVCLNLYAEDRSFSFDTDTIDSRSG